MARITAYWDWTALTGNATTDNNTFNENPEGKRRIFLGGLPREIKVTALDGYKFINGGNIQLFDTDNTIIWTLYPKKINDKEILVTLPEENQNDIATDETAPKMIINIRAYKTETLTLKGEHFKAYQSYDEYLQNEELTIGDNSIPVNTDYFKSIKNTFTFKADTGYKLTNIHLSSFSPDMSNDFDVEDIDEKETTFSIDLTSQSDIEIDVQTEELQSPEPEPDPDPEPEPEPDPDPEPEPEPPDNNQDDYNFTIFNAIYYMDKENLKYLANALPSVNLGDESKDEVSPFIIDLLRLPFKIPNEYIGDETVIKIGNRVYDKDFDGERKAKTINKDLIIIDLGNIKVPHKYNNTYDFVNTDIYLNIPNSQKISLPIEYVIGYNVSIEFIINLFNGEGTLNIYSNKTDTVIHSEVMQLGQEIPFFMNKEKTSVGNINISPIVNNKIKQPFIEVIRNKPINDDMFLNKVEKTGYLRDITGYAEISNVKMNIKATTDEINKIESLLKDGVIING